MALRTLLAAAVFARAAAEPTTLCLAQAPADAAAGRPPACIARAKYALESARGAAGDFGVQGADYTSCERRGRSC